MGGSGAAAGFIIALGGSRKSKSLNDSEHNESSCGFSYGSDNDSSDESCDEPCQSSKPIRIKKCGEIKEDDSGSSCIIL